MKMKSTGDIFSETTRDRLFRFASSLLGCRDDAEDAVHDILMRLWRRKSDLEAVKNPEAFAMTSVRNICIDKIRRRHGTTDEIPDGIAEERSDSWRDGRPGTPGNRQIDASDEDTVALLWTFRSADDHYTEAYRHVQQRHPSCCLSARVTRSIRRPRSSRPYSVMFQLCFALRIMYTYNAVRKNAALLHASVILCNDVAVLFLGSSGTGKSTHSRLWLENIPGAELLNDDNPVIRIEDGKVNVYGTPWSGKTPCYRNVTAPVCAFVRLSQAPENKVRKLSGLDSFTNIISSASSIRWERGVMDGIMSVMSYSAMHVKCLYMECLPNKEAAEICYGETVKSM